MRYTSSIFACLWLSAAGVFADVSSFSNPPASEDPNSNDFSDNPLWSIDDSKTIQWNSSFQQVTILLEQKDNNFRPVLIDNQPNPGFFTWTVSYNDFGDQLNSNSMMRFLLYQAPTQNHVYSHFFNFSSEPDLSSIVPQTTPPTIVIPVTASTSSATKTTSPTSTGTVVIVSTTANDFVAAQAVGMSSATSSAATPSATSHGLDASTQAGLGVGLGVGIPLLGLLGGILYLLARRNKRNQRQMQQLPAYHSHIPNASYSSTSNMLSFPSDSPRRGFATQPEMHAVPVLSAPPPARFIAHHQHTNSDGYAPPSAKLKPWPVNDGEDWEYETKRIDAYGRPVERTVLNEAPGDNIRYGPSEMDASLHAKELPALPLTPTDEGRRQREISAEEEEARLRKLLAG